MSFADASHVAHLHVARPNGVKGKDCRIVHKFVVRLNQNFANGPQCVQDTSGPSELDDAVKADGEGRKKAITPNNNSSQRPQLKRDITLQTINQPKPINASGELDSWAAQETANHPVHTKGRITTAHHRDFVT